MSKRIIFIVGGGTGGHIYPGVAIARALQKADSSVEVHFVGTATGLETKIVPREGFKLHLIQGGKLNFSGGVLTKIKTMVKLPVGLLQSFGLLFKHKPIFVLGVGGYASGPFVLAAALTGFHTGIWEPNAQPGMANRWLARFVDCCYVVFANANQWLKNKSILQFGMPVRSEIENFQRPARSDQDFHLLSFGGSQGSALISKSLAEAVTATASLQKNVQVVQQVPGAQVQNINDIYKATPGLSASVVDYIYDMPKYYGWADLVVARGGASTIMELAACGVVPIIIPLPAADDHQQRNAETLLQAQAGVMILQKDLSADVLAKAIQNLREKPAQLQQMSQQLKTLFKPQAAERIAADIIQRAGHA